METSEKGGCKERKVYFIQQKGLHLDQNICRSSVNGDPLVMPMISAKIDKLVQ